MKKSFPRISSADARQFIIDHLTDDTFLGRGGYTLRQNLYVLPYSPTQENDAKDLIKAMCEHDLPLKSVSAENINLYDIVLKFLDEKDIWNALCEAERDADREDIIMMLQDTVSVSDVIQPAVEERLRSSECDLAFITGIGETFPYIRTHALLNKIETDKPIVFVFPGEYRQYADGSTSLDILNIPSQTNGGYYRATSIFEL
ncbi:MAG: DUF1788 domain-containing protein [Raoultibacter sp.]